jgi:hypothetical protein
VEARSALLPEVTPLRHLPAFCFPSLSFALFSLLRLIPTQSTTITPASLTMAHDQPSQADGEPQDAPDPPIALDDFASSEIPDLESSWVDSGDGNAHQLTALSEENQLQDIAQPPVAHHHCAACTDPACEGAGSTAAEVGSHDTSVGIDFHTVRNKTPTELVLQEHASAATLQDVPSSEPIGPDLFQRLSPEIRDMIFALVYAGSNLFAGVQGSCTRDFGGRLAEHKETRTESAVHSQGYSGHKRPLRPLSQTLQA